MQFINEAGWDRIARVIAGIVLTAGAALGLMAWQTGTGVLYVVALLAVVSGFYDLLSFLRRSASA